MNAPAPNNDIAHWPSFNAKSGLTSFITPHALARSAIFSTQIFRSLNSRPRHLEETPIKCMGKMSVSQLSGEQLDQNDADVFYELLKRGLQQGDSSSREARVQFNCGELIKALGRKKGGKTTKLLNDSIERLTDATFQFLIPELFTGRSRLILKALTKENASGLECDYDVLIDVELANLFANGQWSFLRKKERAAIAGDPLAKGLHAYYSTHKEPYPILVETLQALMGRESMQFSKFKRALEDSLANLKTATGWHTCEISQSGRHAGKVVILKQKPEAGKTSPKVAAVPAREFYDDDI